MSARPKPSFPAPPGFRHEAIEDTAWIVPPCGAGRCRYVVGPRHQACGRPPVATLLRGLQRRAYDYCEQHLYGRWMENNKVMLWHLYGRWIENNKVMSWRLVADSAAEQGEAK